MITSILDYLDQSAQLWAEKIAIADDKNHLSFLQWKDLAERIGTVVAQATNKALRSPVLVFTDRKIECLVGFMGVVESGNFYVPIDSRMPFERVRLIVEVLDPIAAIAITESDQKTLKQISFDKPIITYSESIQQKKDIDYLLSVRNQMIDLDPVYSIFTSGSTGIPKGVLISQRGMIDLADWLVDTFNFTHEDALGNQTPFYFDGSVKDICICLKAGATLNIIGKKYI